MILCSTISFGSLANITFDVTLNLPSTTTSINKAIDEGLDIVLKGELIDSTTGIGYALLSKEDNNKYCDYINEEQYLRSDLDYAYINLLLNGENVVDYGWPFSDLEIDERWANFAHNYHGDMISGRLWAESPILQEALVVCKTLIKPEL